MSSGRLRSTQFAGPGSDSTRPGRASQRLLVVGDGEFSAAKLRGSLPERAVLFSRCAHYALPENAECKRGRKRKYGQIGESAPRVAPREVGLA